MKKLLLFSVATLLGTASCRTQCPAYSTTKPDTRAAAPAMASAAEAPERQ